MSNPNTRTAHSPNAPEIRALVAITGGTIQAAWVREFSA